MHSDTSGYAHNSMISVYADTAVFVGESIHSIYSDSSLVSMNAMSSVYADTAYYALGYTPTSELGVVALSNDFNDLLNIPDYVSPGDITGITPEQAAAIELNTAKVGITSEQADAIIVNSAKVGYSDELVSANSSVAANTAKVGISNEQAEAIVLNTEKVGISVEQANAIESNTTAISAIEEIDANNSRTISRNFRSCSIKYCQSRYYCRTV